MAVKLFRKAEAARHCGVTTPTIEAWIRNGYHRPDDARIFLEVVTTEGGQELVTAASVRKLARARAADREKTEEETE